MLDLPEPKPTATAAGQATRNATINDAADEMLDALNAAIERAKHQTSYNNPDLPSHRDGVQIGDTPHVPQPDSRIVPTWAAGLAVASIGVGAGATGLGCAAWLFFKGLAMVSVPSLEHFAWIVIAPFAGATMLLTAIGGAVSKAKKAALPDVHHHNGPEFHEHRTTNTKAIWNKNINER